MLASLTKTKEDLSETRIRLSEHSQKAFKVTQHAVVIWVIFFQTEFMIEICSKSLVRAIGKFLLIKLS